MLVPRNSGNGGKGFQKRLFDLFDAACWDLWNLTQRWKATGVALAATPPARGRCPRIVGIPCWFLTPSPMDTYGIIGLGLSRLSFIIFRVWYVLGLPRSTENGAPPRFDGHHHTPSDQLTTKWVWTSGTPQAKSLVNHVLSFSQQFVTAINWGYPPFSGQLKCHWDIPSCTCPSCTTPRAKSEAWKGDSTSSFPGHL